MNLGMLLELHECGALNVDANSNKDVAIVGGMTLNAEQCNAMAINLGWTRFDRYPHEIIDKTNKFIRGLKHNIKQDDVFDNTEISFQNTRRHNTEKTSDRIKMIYPGKFDITILYGVPGMGGPYGIYSDVNNFNVPVKICRSLKQVGEYITEIAQ